MRKRERLDSILSLLIFLIACALLVIYRSSCDAEHDYRKAWVGTWTLDDAPDYHYHFKRDGTWDHSEPGVSIDPIRSGIYSVSADRFRITSLYAYFNLAGDPLPEQWSVGAWERVADKLVLYVEPNNIDKNLDLGPRAMIFTISR